jgi:hypothetical protein
MKNTVNEAFIQRRAKLARWSSLIGLGVLFLGLLASFNQQYFYYSLPALIIGFLLANVSGFNANRYLKEPRPDQVLVKVLRGFDNSYHLFNYTAPIPHVLLTPSHVYALLVKPQEGVIRVRGKRWGRAFSLRRVFLLFGEESLGNPPRDALADANRLHAQLEKTFGDNAPAVEPVVIFTNPGVELDMGEASPAEGPDVPVLTGSALKKYIRAQPKGEAFSRDLRKDLASFLKGRAVSQEDEDDAE